MTKRAPTLRTAIKLLRKYYGAPSSPPTTDPFELILWENVAYMAPLAQRQEAFQQLKKVIGTDPESVFSASRQKLERITGRGILKGSSAAKLHECARIAMEQFDGDLQLVVQQPIESAKRALRKFPGIGEPGAEKILLFSGKSALLAADSNALRVLVRLGFLREQRSYAATYASSREVAKQLPAKTTLMQEAHLLLQRHGQILCKRAAPWCIECPLRSICAYGSTARGSDGDLAGSSR